MAEQPRNSLKLAAPPPHLGPAMQQWFSTLVPQLDREYWNMRTVTASERVQLDDTVMICDATGGAITIDLPPTSAFSGKILAFKKIDNVANVTLDGNASEEIDGSTTYVLSTQYDGVILVSDGSQWLVLASI